MKKFFHIKEIFFYDNLSHRPKAQNQKSNFYYTRGITPKRAASGGAHLCGLVPGLQNSEETLLRWRAVGHNVSI